MTMGVGAYQRVKSPGEPSIPTDGTDISNEILIHASIILRVAGLSISGGLIISRVHRNRLDPGKYKEAPLQIPTSWGLR